MADAAHIATDRELELIENKLLTIYTRAEKEVSEKWCDYLEKASAKIKPLQDQLAKAQAKGDAALITQLQQEIFQKQRAVTVMNGKYKRLTAQLANEISKVNQTAVDYVNEQTPRVFTLNYNYIAQNINDLDLGISFELVDKNTVKKLILEEPALLPSQTINHAKDVAWNIRKTNSEVLQGILQGESMPKIAKRFSTVMAMNATSAIRNARTAVTSAENSGRMEMMHEAEEKGVLCKKQWIATHDSRTRHWHAELDGVVKEIDEPFENVIHLSKTKRVPDKIMYPADPEAHPANVYNCRCTLGYVVTGFKPKTPVSFKVTGWDIYEKDDGS